MNVEDLYFIKHSSFIRVVCFISRLLLLRERLMFCMPINFWSVLGLLLLALYLSCGWRRRQERYRAWGNRSINTYTTAVLSFKYNLLQTYLRNQNLDQLLLVESAASISLCSSATLDTNIDCKSSKTYARLSDVDADSFAFLQAIILFGCFIFFWLG